MVDDARFEGTLRTLLHDVLDAERGPHPDWAVAPARARTAGMRRGASTRLRLLLIAAAVGLGGIVAIQALSPQPPPSVELRNGWLALSIDPGGAPQSEVWIVGQENGPRALIPQNGRIEEECAAFAPQGDRIAWTEASTTERGRDTTIVIAPVDATAALGDHQRFAVEPGPIAAQTPTCPQWSPDGSRLVYTLGRQVRILDTTTGAMRLLPFKDGVYADLAWSPDGTLIALTDRRVIQIVGVDRSPPPVVIGPVLDEEYDSIAWSPDGKRLAIWGENHAASGSSFIRVVELASLTAVDLETDGPVYGPRWSPDGRLVAFVEQRSRIVISAPDATARRVLEPAVELGGGEPLTVADDLVWAPDGSRIAVAVVRRDPTGDEARDRWGIASVELREGAVPLLLVPLDRRRVVPLSWQVIP